MEGGGWGGVRYGFIAMISASHPQTANLQYWLSVLLGYFPSSTAAIGPITQAPTTTTATTATTASPTVIPTASADFVCPTSSGYFRDPNDCGMFWVCVFSVPYRMSCPLILQFDRNFLVCNYPELVDCT